MKKPKVKAAFLLDRLILADAILRQVRRYARRTGPLPTSGVIPVEADAQLVRAALGKKKREA
jgi:hypothetical protein